MPEIATGVSGTSCKQKCAKVFQEGHVTAFFPGRESGGGASLTLPKPAMVLMSNESCAIVAVRDGRGRTKGEARDHCSGAGKQQEDG